MSSEPTRKETIERLGDEVGKYLGDAIKKALDEATRCCLTCENFIEGPPDRSGELCGLNHRMPPPSIAARGCDNWEDKIPF